MTSNSERDLSSGAMTTAAASGVNYHQDGTRELVGRPASSAFSTPTNDRVSRRCTTTATIPPPAFASPTPTNSSSSVSRTTRIHILSGSSSHTECDETASVVRIDDQNSWYQYETGEVEITASPIANVSQPSDGQHFSRVSPLSEEVDQYTTFRSSGMIVTPIEDSASTKREGADYVTGFGCCFMMDPSLYDMNDCACNPNLLANDLVEGNNYTRANNFEAMERDRLGSRELATGETRRCNDNGIDAPMDELTPLRTFTKADNSHFEDPFGQRDAGYTSFFQSKNDNFLTPQRGYIHMKNSSPDGTPSSISTNTHTLSCKKLGDRYYNSSPTNVKSGRNEDDMVLWKDVSGQDNEIISQAINATSREIKNDCKSTFDRDHSFLDDASGLDDFFQSTVSFFKERITNPVANLINHDPFESSDEESCISNELCIPGERETFDDVDSLSEEKNGEESSVSTEARHKLSKRKNDCKGREYYSPEIAGSRKAIETKCIDLRGRENTSLRLLYLERGEKSPRPRKVEGKILPGVIKLNDKTESYGKVIRCPRFSWQEVEVGSSPRCVGDFAEAQTVFDLELLDISSVEPFRSEDSDIQKLVLCPYSSRQRLKNNAKCVEADIDILLKMGIVINTMTSGEKLFFLARNENDRDHLISHLKNTIAQFVRAVISGDGFNSSNYFEGEDGSFIDEICHETMVEITREVLIGLN